ncbi:MAG: MarR family winged helix-turn-helix transcriptional regulator [Candidatus Sumerlaeota bacterium]
MVRKKSTARQTKLPEIGVGKLLRQAHMAFAREFRARLAEHSFTFGEFIHLERLWEEDGLNQKELSRRIGIASASSTQIIEALEQRKLIKRERNRGDRRHINIFLTAQGAAKKRELLSCAKQANRLARNGLSPEAVQALFDTVQMIIRNLETCSLPNAGKPSTAD